jgi:hypothetical protein
MHKSIQILLILTFLSLNIEAQNQDSQVNFERESSYGSPDDESLPMWVRKMYTADPNVQEVMKLYKEYYKTNEFVKTQHTQYYKRWIRHVGQFIDDKGFIRPPSKEDKDRDENNFLQNKAKATKQLQTRGSMGAADWQGIGPFDFDKDAAGTSHAPGAAHVYTLEKAPSNPDILYCGTASAGVWKTTNRGESWTNVTKNLPINYCNAVEIHPTDPNIVWIGANNSIYKTTDGGTNWAIIGDASFKALSHDIDDIALQPNNPNVLFVASNKGFYRSADGGNTFTRIIHSNSSSKSYFSEIEFKPNDANIVYVVQSAVNDKYTEFYKSTDGGLTFTIMSGWPVIASTNTTNLSYINLKTADNGYATFANDNLGTTTTPDFTIEMRVRVPNSIAYKAFLSNKNWDTGEANGWALGARFNGELTFNMGNGSSLFNLNSPGMWDNQWHHIAIVYRASGSKEMYKDGVLVASSTATFTSNNSGLPMVLGRDGNLNAARGGFNIDMDDIRIWNTPLSITEINTWKNVDLNTTHPKNSNLLHYYKCNSISSGIADEQGTNNGTIVGTITNIASQTHASTTNLASTDHQKRAEISVTAANPNRIYALLSGNANGGIGLYGFYVSDDAGASWTHKCCGSGPGGSATAAPGGVTTPSTNANLLGYSEVGSDNDGQYYYDLALEADPNNGEKVHVGGINHWYSTDGGNTFTLTAKWSWPDNAKYIHADIHGIHIYGNEVWVNCDGGIFLSQDSGKVSFNRRQYGIAGTEFWGFGMGHKDGNVMLGGTYHNSHLMKNGDVYLNGWVSYTGSADGTRGFVNPVKNKQVYNDSRRDILPDSRTVSPKRLDLNKLPNTNPTSKIIWDPRCYNCIYTGTGSDLWYSEDDGVTWVLVKNFGTMEVADIEIGWDDPNILWVTTANDVNDTREIWRSTDRGINWTNVTPSPTTLGYPSDMWLDISLGSNSQDVWLATTHRYGWNSNNAHKVFYSSNGGSSWTDWTTSTIANESVNQMVYQRGTNGGIYIGTRRSVFYRNKTMSDWVQFDAGLPAATYSTRLFPWYKEGKIRNATSRSVWESPLYEIGQPHAQPMVDKFTSNCSRDTFYFADYSAHYGTATFSWVITPTPQYISSTTAENPKVVFGASGDYTVALTVTDSKGSSTKTVTNMVKLTPNTDCNVSTVIGKAMSLTTNGDYLETHTISLNKDNGSNNNEVSLMAWVKPNGVQSAFCSIVGTTSGNVELIVRSNNELGLSWNGATWDWSSGLTLKSGEWAHVAMVISANNYKLYLNGKEATFTHSPLTTTTTLNLATNWRIGIDRDQTGRTFKGLIDEVCLYNRALLIEEVREKMHLMKNPATDASLKGYYQFDESSGNVWNKGLVGASPFSGSATRVTSTAPVATGTSQRMSITTGGVKDFSAQNLTLEFPNTGTLPNGDIVVNELTASPDQNPTGGIPLSNIIKKYWIINNYGTNSSFSPLTSIKFNNLTGFATGTASNFKLYKRNFNADGATWGTTIDGADALTGTNLAFTPPQFQCIGVSNAGQFTITNDAATTPPSVSTAPCYPDTVPSQAASFAGVGTSYIISDKPFPNNANDDFSISFWVKTTDAATIRTILGTRNVSNSTSNAGQGWAFVLRSSKLHFELGDGTTVMRVSTTNNINDGAWHHIAGTVHKAGNMALYVDGISIGTQAISLIGTISNGAQLYFGKDNHGGEGAYPFRGLIDEVKIWDVPLTINDVREKMHLTAYPQEPNLVGYYQFNNDPVTLGTLEYDRKAANNLVFNGAATRELSTAPVGGGTFSRLSVSTSGVKTFTDSDCEIDFSGGTLPSGDVVVSKLNIAPNVNPTTGTPLSNKYWIINNFGTNATFSPLTSIKFSNLGTDATGSASNFKLYKRVFNSDATWGTSQDVADALTTANNNTLTFSTNNNIANFGQFTIAKEGLTLSMKVFLEGAFNTTTGKMNDNLRTSGLIPTTEPYTNLGFTYIGGGGGTINSNVLATTGDNAIVDWVFVELLNTSNTVVYTRSALLQVDGDIVDLDGVSPLSINALAGNYFIVIKNRNHLKIKTLAVVPLTTETNVYNFTNNTISVGTTAMKSGTVYLMYAGDLNQDGIIDILDRNNAWNSRNISGYNQNDCNLNGRVDATDRSITWNNRNASSGF